MKDVSEFLLNRTVTFTFFAVLLEAVGNILTVYRDRLSSHLSVDIELLLQSGDDYRQVFLSHLYTHTHTQKDVGHN